MLETLVSNKKGKTMYSYSNYPEGSMRGSGIYSEEVSYDSFDCDSCGETNGDGEVSTDDWGHYVIECEFCSSTYRESSIGEDREDARADADYDAWRESQLD